MIDKTTDTVNWCEGQGKKELSWPPGMLGTLAQFIWDQSLYPNREVSIATAVFILASQFGRAYNVQGLGLNHYLHLIAGTGSGKNFAKRGIGEVYKSVQSRLTEQRYIIREGPGTIVSKEGLIQALVGQDKIPARLCCGSYLGESGFFWKRLFDKNQHDPTALGIQSILLDLYTSSGGNNKIGDSVYSKLKDYVKGVTAPCYSILSDSTTKRFYEAITPEAIAQGFYPRSLVFEFKGTEKENKGFAKASLSEELANWLAGNIKYAMDFETKHDQDAPHPDCLQWINIPFQTETEEWHDQLRREFRRKVISCNEDQDTLAELYSRVAEKIAKAAGIVALATAQPGVLPIIGRIEYLWAIEFVMHGTWPMIAKFNSGELGPQSEIVECYRVLEAELKKYVEITKNGFTQDVMKKLRIPPTMGAIHLIDHPLGGIPITANYLQQKLHKRPCFADSRAGTKSLPNTIQEFVDAGKLILVPPLSTMDSRAKSGAQEQAEQTMRAIRGNYEGKLYFIKQEVLNYESLV